MAGASIDITATDDVWDLVSDNQQSVAVLRGRVGGFQPTLPNNHPPTVHRGKPSSAGRQAAPAAAIPASEWAVTNCLSHLWPLSG